MKREKNELMQFLAGLAMLVAGLFILSQKVVIYSGFWGYGWMAGGVQMSGGLIMIPLIAGIVWLFASGGSFGAKVLTGLGVLIILLGIIMTTNIKLSRVNLFEWIVILVLIFGGAGLLIRVLVADGRRERRGRAEDPRIERTSERIDAIEAELERMKKDQ